jgi:hypothetical protein
MNQRTVAIWFVITTALALAIGFAAGSGWALNHVETETVPWADRVIEDQKIALDLANIQLAKNSEGWQQTINDLKGATDALNRCAATEKQLTLMLNQSPAAQFEIGGSASTTQ